MENEIKQFHRKVYFQQPYASARIGIPLVIRAEEIKLDGSADRTISIIISVTGEITENSKTYNPTWEFSWTEQDTPNLNEAIKRIKNFNENRNTRLIGILSETYIDVCRWLRIGWIDESDAFTEEMKSSGYIQFTNANHSTIIPLSNLQELIDFKNLIMKAMKSQ